MKHRSPAAVLLLSLVTLGIYTVYWFVSTKIEMNKLGAKIPTAWLIIVPIVNIWWMWKWCEGVEVVTNKKMSAGLAFVLTFVLNLLTGLGSLVGPTVIQSSFNEVTGAPAMAAAAPSFGAAPMPPAAAPAPAPEQPQTPPTPPTDQPPLVQ